MDTVERSQVTSVSISKAIGLSEAMVSRIRSGKRIPSMETMGRIEDAYKWDLAEQIRAMRADRYAVEFEKALVR